MSRSSFVVFKDSDVGKAKSSPSHAPAVVSLKEKENLPHDVSGARAAGSKRDNTVLASRKPIPLAVREDPLQALQTLKKRKSSSSSALKERVAKNSGSVRRTKKSTRTVLALTKVEEEEVADVEPSAETVASTEECASTEVALKLKPAPKLDFGEYIPVNTSSKSASGGAIHADIPSKSFSTPERKRIYAAFTFTSPSPTRLDKVAVPIPNVPILNLGVEPLTPTNSFA